MRSSTISRSKRTRLLPHSSRKPGQVKSHNRQIATIASNRRTKISTLSKKNNRRSLSTTSEQSDGEIHKVQWMKGKKDVSPEDAEMYRKLLEQNAQDDDDYEEDETPLTAEELFAQSKPLIEDAYTSEPVIHTSSFIWLPDCFEDYKQHANVFQMLMPKDIRFVIPNPPRRECIILNGQENHAWYDVPSMPFNQDSDYDYTGIKVSMYQIHQLIRSEALTLGTKLFPDLDVEEQISLGSKRVFLGGFGQGGSIVAFSGIRYPYPLGGIICHSGHFPYIAETVQSARQMIEQTNQQRKLEMESNNGVATTPPYDMTASVPNLHTPFMVLHSASNKVVPWQFAQPTFIAGLQPPLKCNFTLRMSRSDGHSIISTDLLDIQFWVKELLTKTNAELTAHFKQHVKHAIDTEKDTRPSFHMALRPLSLTTERVEIPPLTSQQENLYNDTRHPLAIRIGEATEFINLNKPFVQHMTNKKTNTTAVSSSSSNSTNSTNDHNTMNTDQPRNNQKM